MTPDNPQERLRALIEETERKLPVAEARGSELPISYSDLRLLLDAASRSIPAGEDAELVAWLKKASSTIYLATDGPVADDISPKLQKAAARLSSLSSELEQVRARLEKAEEVIRPFAEFAAANSKLLPRDDRQISHATLDDMPLAGWLRAARHWIEGGE